MFPLYTGRPGRSRGAQRTKLSRQEDSYLRLAREDDARSLREDLDKSAGAAGRGNRLAEEGIEPSMPGAEAPHRVERLRRPAIDSGGQVLAFALKKAECLRLPCPKLGEKLGGQHAIGGSLDVQSLSSRFQDEAAPA
jgi:hypothetical protein